MSWSSEPKVGWFIILMNILTFIKFSNFAMHVLFGLIIKPISLGATISNENVLTTNLPLDENFNIRTNKEPKISEQRLKHPISARNINPTKTFWNYSSTDFQFSQDNKT